jgi:hypothetical protein
VLVRYKTTRNFVLTRRSSTHWLRRFRTDDDKTWSWHAYLVRRKGAPDYVDCGYSTPRSMHRWSREWEHWLTYAATIAAVTSMPTPPNYFGHLLTMTRLWIFLPGLTGGSPWSVAGMGMIQTNPNSVSRVCQSLDACIGWSWIVYRRGQVTDEQQGKYPRQLSWIPSEDPSTW